MLITLSCHTVIWQSVAEVLVDWCGSLGSCKPQIYIFLNDRLSRQIKYRYCLHCGLMWMWCCIIVIHSVNSAFTMLRTLIPTEPADRKLSKIETLRLASSYISHLGTQLVAGDSYFTFPWGKGSAQWCYQVLPPHGRWHITFMFHISMGEGSTQWLSPGFASPWQVTLCVFLVSFDENVELLSCYVQVQ